MEPFIIEECFGFLIILIVGGLAVFFIVKHGTMAWTALRSRTQRENPGQKLARIVREAELRLAALQRSVGELRRNHAGLQAQTASLARETAHWREVEGSCGRESKHVADIVRKRIEAEQHETLGRLAESTSQQAIETLEQRCNELSGKIALARIAQATLEARIAAAAVKQGMHDDFGDGAGAALEELESAAIEHEAKADSFEEMSRFSAASGPITEEDVLREIEFIRRKENHHD